MAHAYPEVSGIAVVEGKLVATLGTYFDSALLPGQSKIQLVYGERNRWQSFDETFELRNLKTPPCQLKIPPPTEQELRDWLWQGQESLPDPLFNQYVEACTTNKGDTWAGISWYGGERRWGVGGLVSHIARSGRTEARYLFGLQEYSVNHIQAYADRLWIGTTYHGEGSDDSAGFGIRKYPLNNRGGNVFDVPEVCGFATRNMLVWDDSLWIATELGLSRAKVVKDGELEWTNYVPDLSHPTIMREIGCDDLYSELLSSPRSVTDSAFGRGAMFDLLWDRLSKHRPAFVHRYLRRLHGHYTKTERSAEGQ